MKFSTVGANATRLGDLCRRVSRSSLQALGKNGRMPPAARWRLTFVAALLRVACPVHPREGAILNFTGGRGILIRTSAGSVATNVKLHGTRPWHLVPHRGGSVAANVKLHGTRPWHLDPHRGGSVAANVKLHGTRPWHLDPHQRRFSSNERETPRHKAVAS